MSNIVPFPARSPPEQEVITPGAEMSAPTARPVVYRTRDSWLPWRTTMTWFLEEARVRTVVVNDYPFRLAFPRMLFGVCRVRGQASLYAFAVVSADDDPRLLRMDTMLPNIMRGGRVCLGSSQEAVDHGMDPITAFWETSFRSELVLSFITIMVWNKVSSYVVERGASPDMIFHYIGMVGRNQDLWPRVFGNDVVGHVIHVRDDGETEETDVRGNMLGFVCSSINEMLSGEEMQRQMYIRLSEFAYPDLISSVGGIFNVLLAFSIVIFFLALACLAYDVNLALILAMIGWISVLLAMTLRRFDAFGAALFDAFGAAMTLWRRLKRLWS